MLCWKYAGLFLTTFTATISCVFMFWHLTTWPNVPWPSTSRIRYLSFPNQPVAPIRRTQASEGPPILVLGPEDVVDVEDVVAVLVVEPAVLSRLARLGEHPARVERRLVVERRVHEMVRLREVRRQRAKGLFGRDISSR